MSFLPGCILANKEFLSGISDSCCESQVCSATRDSFHELPALEKLTPLHSPENWGWNSITYRSSVQLETVEMGGANAEEGECGWNASIPVSVRVCVQIFPAIPPVYVWSRSREQCRADRLTSVWWVGSETGSLCYCHDGSALLLVTLSSLSWETSGYVFGHWNYLPLLQAVQICKAEVLRTISNWWLAAMIYSCLATVSELSLWKGHTGREKTIGRNRYHFHG